MMEMMGMMVRELNRGPSFFCVLNWPRVSGEIYDWTMLPIVQVSTPNLKAAKTLNRRCGLEKLELWET